MTNNHKFAEHLLGDEFFRIQGASNDHEGCRAIMPANLDRWMAALNAHDADAMDKELHFPHVRHAEGRLVVYEKPGSNPMDLFTSLIEKSNWDHSAWTKRVPLQAGDTKVHWAVAYTRFRKDGTAIGTYDSLYVMTLKNGEWKPQIRSSFGP